ncbi:Protein of unknown function [Gryllus bimaculatus]|nr:Protein of unknown function [Gryllus bimaculatus]
MTSPAAHEVTRAVAAAAFGSSRAPPCRFSALARRAARDEELTVRRSSVCARGAHGGPATDPRARVRERERETERESGRGKEREREREGERAPGGGGGGAVRRGARPTECLRTPARLPATARRPGGDLRREAWIVTQPVSRSVSGLPDLRLQSARPVPATSTPLPPRFVLGQRLRHRTTSALGRPASVSLRNVSPQAPSRLQQLTVTAHTHLRHVRIRHPHHHFAPAPVAAHAAPLASRECSEDIPASPLPLRERRAMPRRKQDCPKRMKCK